MLGMQGCHRQLCRPAPMLTHLTACIGMYVSLMESFIFAQGAEGRAHAANSGPLNTAPAPVPPTAAPLEPLAHGTAPRAVVSDCRLSKSPPEVPHWAVCASASGAAPSAALAAAESDHLEQPLLWTLCENRREPPEGLQHPALQGALAGAHAPQLRTEAARAGSPAWRTGSRQAAPHGPAGAGRAGGWPRPGQALRRMAEGVGQPGAPRGSVPSPKPCGPAHWPRRAGDGCAAAARVVAQAAAAPAAPTLPPGALQPRPRKPRRGHATHCARPKIRKRKVCLW